MNRFDLPTLGKYVIALAVIIGGFALIATGRGGDNTAAYGLIGAIVGWVVRDSAGTSATTNAIATIAAASAPAPVEPSAKTAPTPNVK